MFPIRQSDNLVDWIQVAYVFPGNTRPKWAGPPFYAPELHAACVPNGHSNDSTRNTGGSGRSTSNSTSNSTSTSYGSDRCSRHGNTQYIFAVYDAMEISTGVMAIGIAWSRTPAGSYFN